MLKPGEISSIRDDVPGEGHGDVLVAHQPIPIVPEVIFRVHAASWNKFSYRHEILGPCHKTFKMFKIPAIV